MQCAMLPTVHCKGALSTFPNWHSAPLHSVCCCWLLPLYEPRVGVHSFVLNAFAKFGKSDYNLHYVCLSVCLSVLRKKKLSFLWADFHEILYASIFRKFVQKIQVSLKCDKTNWLDQTTDVHLSLIKGEYLVKNTTNSEQMVYSAILKLHVSAFIGHLQVSTIL